VPIAVIQHSDVEGPGRLGATLRDHGWRLEIWRPDLPASPGRSRLPRDLRGLDAVVSLGGAQDATDEGLAHDPWLHEEAGLLRRAHEADIPVFGICLGAQLLAHALGGTVERMARPVIGFPVISLTTDGQVDPLLAGVPWDVPQFAWHGCEVRDLPAEAVLLATSAYCRVQAFRAGLRSIGFQYHFECDLEMIRRYADADADALAAAGTSARDLDAAGRGCYERHARAADRLCVNITSLALAPRRRRTA
jgi:GMP synthase (glutamine-hydrolysing)